MGSFTPDTKLQDNYVIPAGSYAARLYMLVDLGHQYVQYPGESGAWSRKIRLGWEIPELTAEFEDKETHEKTIKPRVIGREYTLSYYASAHLKVDVQSWIGRDLTVEEQEKGYDLPGLLGKTCMLSVAHKEGKNKDGQAKTFANVAGIMACPRGLTVPKQFNPTMLYEIENDPGNKVFDTLYKWLQEKVRKAKEFQGEAEPETEAEPPDLSDMSVPFDIPDIPDVPEVSVESYVYGPKTYTREEWLDSLHQASAFDHLPEPADMDSMKYDDLLAAGKVMIRQLQDFCANKKKAETKVK